MSRNLCLFSRRIAVTCAILSPIVLGFGQSATAAQKSPTATNASAAASAQALVPQLIKFSGTLTDLAGKPISGAVDVTFSLYSQESGGTPLWYESQTVNANAAGEYTTLLGAMTATGVPMDLFTSGQARWLGVAVRGLPEQSRILLVSVPYAMTSGNSEMLGGKPAADYLLASQSGTSSTTATTALVGTSSTTNGRTANQLATATPQSITTGGTANYLAAFSNNTGGLGNSVIYQNPTTSNIGIGTTTPGYALTIVTNAPGQGIMLNAQTYGAGYHMARAGVEEGFFSVAGAAGGFSHAAVANDVVFGAHNAGSGGNLIFTTQNATGSIKFATGSSPKNDTVKMTVTNAGNVGVGTAAPLASTEIAGPLSTSTPATILDLSRGYNAGIAYVSAASFLLSDPAVGAHNTRLDIALRDANRSSDALPDTTVMSLVSNGKVGIGTTTPATKLDVNGTVTATSFNGDGSGLTNVGGSTTLITGSTATLTSTTAAAAATLTNTAGGAIITGSNASGQVFSVGNTGGITSGALVTTPGVSNSTTDCTAVTSAVPCTSANLLAGYGSGKTVAGANTITSGVIGATIGGGGGTDNAGDNFGNTVGANWGTVGGGLQNSTGGFTAATVSGGWDNTASGNVATVAGGYSNQASGDHATVGGGESNSVAAGWSSIGGGYNNSISGTANFDDTISGGDSNSVTANDAGTVPGGFSNTAAGNFSFAAGCEATANNNGSFVWDGSGTTSQDTCGAAVSDSAAGQFVAMAPGGFRFFASTSTTSPVFVIAPTTGNVGIGTGSPASTLDVSGTVTATTFVGDGSGLTNVGGSTTVITGSTATLSSTSTTAAATLTNSGGGAILSGKNGGGQVFGVTNSGGAYFAGSVGVGTTQPLTKVEIAGSPSTSTPATVLDLSRGYNAGVAYLSAASFLLSNPAVGAHNTRLDIALRNANHSSDVLPDTTVMSLVSNGNVGIGTTSPGEPLDVSGNIRTSTCFLAGSTVVGGTCSSDKRLKTDIRNFTPSLDRLAELQPVRFNWRASNPAGYRFGPGRSTGLVAQQVRNIFPQMVSTDKNGYYQVNYSLLPFMLLAGEKQLKARNDILRAQVTEARAQIASLRRIEAAKDSEVTALAAQNRKLAGQVAQLKKTATAVAALEARLARDEAQARATRTKLARAMRQAKKNSHTELARVQF